MEVKCVSLTLDARVLTSVQSEIQATPRGTVRERAARIYAVRASDAAQ